MYLEDGSEQEFFPNERLEIVLDVIKQYVQDHPNELRRVDILNSILVANKKFSNKGTERRSKTKDSLKGCNEMNASLEGKLKELGCMVMGGKKHYKIRYHGDTRYQVSMSKTSSDARSGQNLAAEIGKKMM